MLETKFPGPTKCPFVMLALVLMPDRKAKRIEEIFQCEKCHWYRRLPLTMHHPFKEGETIDKDVYDCAIPWGYFVSSENSRQTLHTASAVEELRNRTVDHNETANAHRTQLLNLFMTAMQPAPESPQLLDRGNGNGKTHLLSQENQDDS